MPTPDRARAHVYLDNVIPFPAQQSRNLDQLVQRVVTWAPATVFLQARHPRGTPVHERTSLPRFSGTRDCSTRPLALPPAPIRRFLDARAQFRLDPSAAVPRWDPETARSPGPDQSNACRRCPQVRKIIGEIMSPARNNAIDGVLYHDDAVPMT